MNSTHGPSTTTSTTRTVILGRLTQLGKAELRPQATAASTPTRALVIPESQIQGFSRQSQLAYLSMAFSILQCWGRSVGTLAGQVICTEPHPNFVFQADTENKLKLLLCPLALLGVFRKCISFLLFLTPRLQLLMLVKSTSPTAETASDGMETLNLEGGFRPCCQAPS